MNRRVLISSLPLAGVLVAACGPQQTADRTTGSTPAAGGASATGAPSTQNQAGKPQKGGTLTMAMARDATNFDPLRQNDVYSAVVLNNVADTLYEIDSKGSVVGRLVEKTENPQPNVYVMTLRKGIKFSDGTDLNAEAVKFNLERHMTNAQSVRNQDVKDITAIEMPDPFTVRITLKTAFAPFATKLTGGAGYILNPKAVQALGEGLQRDLKDAGSGAYKFVSWQKDTAVTLERNTTYWKKDTDGSALPYLDRLVFKPFPDENVRLTNLRTGDADALIANPPYKDISDLKKDTNLNVNEVPGIGWQLIFLNTSVEPFNNAAVRRAFSYAIDRAQVQQTVFFGNGNALGTPVMPSIPWANLKDDPFMKRDLAKARQEMQAAGKSTVKFALQISNASPELQQTAELIKDQIKDVGLDMEIQLLEFATVVANGGSGAHQSLALGWSGDVDPDTLYSLLYTGAGFNFGKYSNPQMDKLLADGRATVEQAKRADIYKELQRLSYTEVPFITYFNAPQIATTRKSVQSWPNTYNGYWGTRDLDKAWKRS
ncbi:MAG TPA: ABC transporter substrate-binding protein [Chloroflexota bacterium]|nr:ABC transporter substrate-binding protein [Chloroflexota bacterium]